MVLCHERETHSAAWWLHQMETFSVYWCFVRRSPGNSPQKGQWRGTLIFSLICALNNRLNKQSRGWWFETPLWRHCNGILTRGKNDQSYFSDRWMMISINGTLVLRVIIKKIVIRCKVYSLGVSTFNLFTTIIIFCRIHMYEKTDAETVYEWNHCAFIIFVIYQWLMFLILLLSINCSFRRESIGNRRIPFTRDQ